MYTQPLFNDLNERQLEAVKTTEGRLRIVAGAGSGKTRVIAHRYAYLVNVLGIDPAGILCMTFTNKAAQEMKSRIATLVHRGNVNDYVCTIHGFCVRFLRQEIFRLGWPANFQIIDEQDAKVLAKHVMQELGLDRTKATVRKFLAAIGLAKGQQRQHYVGRYMLPGSKDVEGSDEFSRYLKVQLKHFVLDYDDLVYFTLYIFDHFETVRRHWQQEINYVQVDEVQDCDRDEWDVINAVSGGYNNLCIVGDPDQAIYEWRGARPSLFVNFKSDRDIFLTENYRSTPNILDVANSIIAHNRDRLPKELFTRCPAGAPVLYHHFKGETQESEWIVRQIKKNVAGGEAQNSDFAILYRASYLSRSIEQELIKQKVKYVVWGGIRFFERREIKDALAYLSLVARNDDLSFMRVVNLPSRKFGPASMQRLARLALDEDRPLYDTLAAHRGEAAFGHCKLDGFVRAIEQARQAMASGKSIGDIFELLMRTTGLKDLLRKDEDEDRLENLDELAASIAYYEDEHRNDELPVTIERYLQDIALYTNADYRKDGTAVRLMTIHQAKGLEFPCVIVVGMTEGIFPSHRALRERKRAAEEEERRLMYVAVTRAQRVLVLTESEGYDNAVQGEKYPPRFIGEIDERLLTVKGNPDPQLFAASRALAARLAGELEMATRADEAGIHLGDVVAHPVFGQGVVIEQRPGGSLVVKFAVGNRMLMPAVLTKCE